MGEAALMLAELERLRPTLTDPAAVDAIDFRMRALRAVLRSEARQSTQRSGYLSEALRTPENAPQRRTRETAWTDVGRIPVTDIFRLKPELN